MSSISYLYPTGQAVKLRKSIFLDKSKVVIIITIQIEGVIPMQTIQKYVPVTRAKTMLLDLVRKIKDSDETIAITKNGVPEVVLISMNTFTGLLETLEILSDEKAMKSIRKSIRQADKGMWVDFEEVLAE